MRERSVARDDRISFRLRRNPERQCTINHLRFPTNLSGTGTGTNRRTDQKDHRCSLGPDGGGDLRSSNGDIYRLAYQRNYREQADHFPLQAFPGILDMLEALRNQGAKLALVTSKRRRSP